MSGVQLRDRPRVHPRSPDLPIEPRMAARWVAVRRDQHRRRMRLLTIALAVVTVMVLAWLLARSPLLGVRHVVVRGMTRTNRAQVVAAARLAGHPAMLGVNLEAIEARVEALPWVAHAGVQRHWPNTLTIAITERAPAARTDETAGQPALLDSRGRILAVGQDALAVLGGPPPLAPLPVLQGVAPVGRPGSTFTPALGPLQALAVLETRLGEHGSGVAFRVTGMGRSADGSLQATLAPGPTNVILGSTDQLEAKAAALRSVLARLTPGAPVTIDVRVADAPVLTESQNSSRFSTTQRG